MALKQKRIVFILAGLVVLAVAAGATWWYLSQQKTNNEPGGDGLIEKSYCSDLCPQNTRKFRIYPDVKSQAECDARGGQTIKDAAWGGFIGCQPRPDGEPAVIKG